MKTFSGWSNRSVVVVGVLLCMLVMSIAACGGTDGNVNASNVTPVATKTVSSSTGGTVASPTPVPGVKLGVQPCPVAVSAPSHWTGIVNVQANVNFVESVTCANMMGVPTLQALVTVRSYGTGKSLDAYVYNNITDPSPTKIFSLLKLYTGEAKISAYNTVVTAEINTDGATVSTTPDVFREFKWIDSAQTLVPVSFPAFYPDMTRYQAESDQQTVNQGQDNWKLDAGQVAVHLSSDMLQFLSSSQATIISGGGKNDKDAVVEVKDGNGGTGTLKITMSRLEGNVNGGIWEATDAVSPNMSIKGPADRARISSPQVVTGTGNAFEGVVGTVEVLDNTYTNLGNAQVTVKGNGTSLPFSTNLTYKSTYKVGLQEGVVMLLTQSNKGDGIAGAVIVKVLIAG